ncbi:phosphoenolpyruvate--protein phosphotransferase [Lysinibacillus mangiferihumi]|uniref:Phosphoenolpyruvate-protein phosphotransferase n=1 Tax=Lysinibacillus mangiferihumi TaxID=1130819 RepID=A0A4U2YRC2_9BACI|nr:phosphoenolpyruvate--protein phosphotransferase [Lysinibacillus mangiferihumi]TKI63222.1 phosphoenolpyruvate--protein phosphotransferase [Lysinibacillus mangiferihumi]
MNFQGIAASSGIAIAKAYILVEPNLSFNKKTIEDNKKEIERFRSALSIAKRELKDIREFVEKEFGASEAAIFDAHILVLNDPELITTVEEKISLENVNVEYAFKETTDMFIAMFEGMDGEYMQQRAGDIRDVTKRVMTHLLGAKVVNPSMISEEVIIIAEDLTPSDTAQLNRKYVKGFATNIGGRTSHSAIMARSLEIPAVVGTREITQHIQDGDMVVVDGLNGIVQVNPTFEQITIYEKKHQKYMEQKAEWAKLVNEKTVTADHHHVELAANIGNPEDLAEVISNGGEGIGLYRTEFLYMSKDRLPTEDEQFEAYKSVLQGMGNKPVVVRTLDIGGDKELPYLKLSKELNPFLGFRAIRLCLEEKHIFRTQLRALLRASSFGNLKIMFPMVATLDEFRQATAILKEEKHKLLEKGAVVAEGIEIGIMVELPSTAILADQFAKEVDFFSIGTNDLIQYTMAADRMNERVSYLYQPYNPAILRLVKIVIDASHREGKWTGMCGEMAGDEIAIPLLLGLGLDEFSMSASAILKARTQISQLKQSDMVELANEVLQLRTNEEVARVVRARCHL